MPALFLYLVDGTRLWVIGLILLALMTCAFFIGRRLRARAGRFVEAKGRGHKKSEFDGYIVSAVLGLLALLLGFTFSLAIQRFEERRQLVVEEANAIGTANLRVQVLARPFRGTLIRLLREHADNEVRLGEIGYPNAGPLRARDDRLMARIWALTSAALTSPGMAPYAYFLAQPVNEMIDLNATRRAVRMTRVPTEVFAVLLAYLVSVAGVLGYEIGGRATTIVCFVLALMTLSLLLIMDIDRPAAGGIRESQEAMEQLLLSLQHQPSASPDLAEESGKP